MNTPKRTYKKRLIVENPPAEAKRGRPAKNHEFLRRVEAEAPNQWVRWTLKAKSRNVIHGLSKHPDWIDHMEYVTRSNGDGTFGVWVRVKPRDDKS